jgi:hypothetical protein
VLRMIKTKRRPDLGCRIVLQTRCMPPPPFPDLKWGANRILPLANGVANRFAAWVCTAVSQTDARHEPKTSTLNRKITILTSRSTTRRHVSPDSRPEKGQGHSIPLWTRPIFARAHALGQLLGITSSRVQNGV